MKQVLFDMDGVLVHSWRFRDHLEDEFGIDPRMTRPFFTGPFVRCIVGEADLYEELPPFLARWGWDGPVDSFVELWFREDAALNEPVLEFAEELRAEGVACHIASNQERHRAGFMSNEMGFAKLFDSLLFSSDLGAAKPDLAFFHEIERRLDTPGSDLVLLDDSPPNLVGARAAHLEAILYTGAESLDEVRRALGHAGT